MCGIAGFFDGNADFTANREKYENILRKSSKVFCIVDRMSRGST